MNRAININKLSFRLCKYYRAVYRTYAVSTRTAVATPCSVRCHRSMSTQIVVNTFHSYRQCRSAVGPGETGVSLIIQKTRERNSAFNPFARVDQKLPRARVLDQNRRSLRVTVDDNFTLVAIRARPPGRIQFVTAPMFWPCTNLTDLE